MEADGCQRVEVCLGLACQDAGSRDLLAALAGLTGIKPGRTDADGARSLTGGICQGRCAVGPNVRVDWTVLSGQSPDRASHLFERIKEMRKVPEKPY